MMDLQNCIAAYPVYFHSSIDQSINQSIYVAPLIPSESEALERTVMVH